MDVEGRHAFWTTMREFAARGKTVLFATHYLEEADAYADRAVLMARGRVVIDGPTTEIKAMVGVRTIRATLPEADLAALARLPGVTSADGRARRSSCVAPTPMRPCVRSCRHTRRRAISRSPAPGSRRPSSS
jgi:ABC-type multidrug transport system ATPase subunit